MTTTFLRNIYKHALTYYITIYQPHIVVINHDVVIQMCLNNNGVITYLKIGSLILFQFIQGSFYVQSIT